MPHAKDLRVLVADDQKSMRELARMCLRGLGVQDIEFAESAEAALERLKEVQVDLIISDWNMDGMSGLDFLKKIRSNPVLKQLPFVMATTERTAEHVISAKNAGVSHYIPKPYSQEALKKTIEHVLGPLV
jgi:two-component system, chemotaxis family, chemotaxis protein CheY